MIMIFSYFIVPGSYQHKVLYWGIFGALAMRIIFIFRGIELIHKFHGLIYLFGGFLIITGVRMVVGKDKPIEPDKNPLVKLVRRSFRSPKHLKGITFL